MAERPTLTFDEPLDPTPTANIALVGPPKTGKTAGACSAPGPVLLLNGDLRERTRYARNKYGEKVRPVQVTGLNTLIAATYAAWEGEFNTVVLDPVGEVYNILVEEKLGGKVPETMNNHILTQFRVVQDELRRFCKGMCKAPVNFVMVFHEIPVQDDGTGEVERLADAGPTKPKLARKLLADVDVIGYTFASHQDDGVHYVAQLAPLKGRNGGDGFGCLLEDGKLAREMDLSEWLEVIKEHENRAA